MNKKLINIKQIIFTTIAIVMVGILIGMVIVQKNRNLPLLFANPPENIKGATYNLNNDWNLYKNGVLGFELIYPTRKFEYGKLQPSETYYAPEIDEASPYLANDPFYEVSFSYGDVPPIAVTIRPTHYNSVEKWFEREYPSYRSDKYELTKFNFGDYIGLRARTISDNPGAFTYEQTAEELFVIRDGVLFELHLYYLPREEREKIFESFRLITD